MRVIVIGAGVIGAAMALRLARAGAEVTVIDAAQAPGAGATGASFGWLNASFFHDADHFALRHAGLKAWRRLADDVGAALSWTGALWWEEQGEGLQEMARTLRELGYDVSQLDRAALSKAEPALAAPPEAALHFAQEGIAEPALIGPHLLAAAVDASAQVLFGQKVLSVDDHGIDTELGRLDADRVVVCAGVQTPGLISDVFDRLNVQQKPGLLLRSAPLPPILSHILVTPEGEIRQDPDGRLIMPATVSHQGDMSERIDTSLGQIFNDAEVRISNVLRGGTQVRWAEAALGQRPVPDGDLPVIGPVSDGVYVAVMHSGMTLAAITAELAVSEILELPDNNLGLLAPYRPDCSRA